MSRDVLGWIDDELEELRRQGLLRTRRELARSKPGRLLLHGQELIDFGSNDYLGLATDPRLRQAITATLNGSTTNQQNNSIQPNRTAQQNWGSGASALVTGYAPLDARLEAELAAFKGTEAALVFSSGFAANVGTITALVGRGDHVYSDSLNHASIIDGCRLSRATLHVYPHADAAALAEALQATPRGGRRLIVTDGLFSMDGDLAPLADLAELADQHAAMLMVDDAHATGVFGAGGRGTAEHFGVEERVDIRLGTLSKALGSVGGFVCGRRPLIDWLVNRARPYIFSTARPPAESAAALAALQIVRDEPHRRETLLYQAERLREQLRSRGVNTGESESQIVPLVVGEPATALALSAELQRRGLLVPAIRPPSVPAGSSRLRVSLSAAHDELMIAQLLTALDAVHCRA